MSFSLGMIHAHMALEVFVNDFLMAIFFLLVGIELKYEVTVGQLRKPRQAMLPMLAAVGGVAVPALIYLALNASSAPHGWATPIATDIAFALGVRRARLVVALRGRNIPRLHRQAHHITYHRKHRF